MNSRYTVRVILAAAAVSSNIWAQDVPPPQGVEQRIEALEKEIRELKKQYAQDQEATTKKVKEMPIVSAGQDGFSLKSADGDFQLKLRGLIQTDARFYLDDKAKSASDTFLPRSIRPILEGTVFRDFDFRLVPDFGNGSATLQDAYLEWKYWPEAKLRFGKFKPPVGLERLQSETDTLFVERALPTNLVPNRDVGVQVGGDFAGGVFSYAVGVINGVADGSSGDLDNGDDKDFAGRIFFQPFKKSKIESVQGLGFGIAGTFGDQQSTVKTPNLPSFKTSGQQTFFSYRSDGTVAGTTTASGVHTRLAPQAYYYYGPFGLLGEYVISEQEVTQNTTTRTLQNEGWQVAASYVLTGEKASYKGVTPRRPFDLKNGGWGALEIAARWNELHVDPTAFPIFADPAKSAKDAQAWGVGANWYLNKNVKLSLDFEQTNFNGGAAGSKDRPTENVILSRAQLAF